MERHRWKQLLAGMMRRPVRAVTRPGYLMVAAVVAAVALSLVLAPRAVSSAAEAPAAGATPGASPATAASPAAAPNDGGVTWTPGGTPVQSDNNGDCEVAMSGTVSAPDAAALSRVDSALTAEAPDPVGQDGISKLTISAPQGESGATSMTVYADAGVDCSLVNQADASVKKAGYGSLGQFSQAVLDARLHPAPAGSRRHAGQDAALLAYDALPAWLRGAIAAVASAAVYAAVSTITAATLMALLGYPAVAITAAVAGCLGGAIAAPVGIAISGSTLTPLKTVASVVAGCLTGGGLGPLVPVATAGQWLYTTLRQYIGTAVNSIVGSQVVAQAAAVEMDLTPIGQAMTNALTALRNP